MKMAVAGKRCGWARVRGSRRNIFLFCSLALVCSLALFPLAFAQDDMIKLVEAKRLELQAKEATLKQEEQRLAVIRKDVDGKIEKYAKLLAQIDALLQKVETIRGDQLENVVKAYEVMTAEEAAQRLAALDRTTALKIMVRMKSKKAGAIIAQMNPQRAAAMTKSMTTFQIRK